MHFMPTDLKVSMYLFLSLYFHLLSFDFYSFPQITFLILNLFITNPNLLSRSFFQGPKSFSQTLLLIYYTFQ